MIQGVHGGEVTGGIALEVKESGPVPPCRHEVGYGVADQSVQLVCRRGRSIGGRRHLECGGRRHLKGGGRRHLKGGGRRHRVVVGGRRHSFGEVGGGQAYQSVKFIGRDRGVDRDGVGRGSIDDRDGGRGRGSIGMGGRRRGHVDRDGGRGRGSIDDRDGGRGRGSIEVDRDGGQWRGSIEVDRGLRTNNNTGLT